MKGGDDWRWFWLSLLFLLERRKEKGRYGDEEDGDEKEDV